MSGTNDDRRDNGQRNELLDACAQKFGAGRPAPAPVFGDTGRGDAPVFGYEDASTTDTATRDPQRVFGQ